MSRRPFAGSPAVRRRAPPRSGAPRSRKPAGIQELRQPFAAAALAPARGLRQRVELLRIQDLEVTAEEPEHPLCDKGAEQVEAEGRDQEIAEHQPEEIALADLGAEAHAAEARIANEINDGPRREIKPGGSERSHEDGEGEDARDDCRIDDADGCAMSHQSRAM